MGTREGDQRGGLGGTKEGEPERGNQGWGLGMGTKEWTREGDPGIGTRVGDRGGGLRSGTREGGQRGGLERGT